MLTTPTGPPMELATAPWLACGDTYTPRHFTFYIKNMSFWQIYGRSHLLGPGQGACHLHLLHLTSQTTSPPPPPPPSRWSPPPPPQPNNLTSQQTGHPLHSVHISPHFGGQSTTNVSHGYHPIRNFRSSLRIVFSSHNFNP